MNGRVYVGLSGGVDSAVSAALLQEQGYDVTGVFIKIWQPEFIECTWREDRLDAMRVAAKLGIPFKEIDLSEEYKTEVVENMVSMYQRGLTPNPDVLCNSSIKFGSFMQWALSQGADFVATGHYARSRGGKLLRGIDTAKDQSYFLYRLAAEDLQKILFPVGELRKSDVRAAAKRFELPVADKPDSQGLCFVGDITLSDFLSRYISLRKGNVLDERGAVIGIHDGSALYTVGQRHGFTLSNPSVSEKPRFVTSVDTANNTVTVSPDISVAKTRTVLIVEANWIGTRPVSSGEYLVQTRYRETPVSATVDISHKGGRVTFVEPHICSAGQSLVVYSADECLGGGEIVRES